MRNFLSLAGAEVVSKVLTFGAFAHLARTVGPASFGYVEFAGAVIMSASLIVDQGFSPYGAREIAKAPERTKALVSEIVAARFALACGAYLAVVLFALLYAHPPIVTRLLLVYGLSLLVAPLLLQWVFQGHDRMRTVAVAQVIRQTVFAATVFAFVRAPDDLMAVAGAEIAGVGGAAGYCVLAYRRQFRAEWRARPRFTRRLWREGVPIGLSQMFWVVRMSGATLLVGLFATAQDVGFFAGAQRILLALHTFVWLYYFNLLPSLTRAWHEGGGAFANLVGRSTRAVAWVGAAGGVVWALAAPAALKGVYGAAFAPAGRTLQWLAGVCVVALLSGHYRFGLIAAGRQSIELFVSASGALAAGALIPIGYARAGTSGAAAGLCVAECVVWLSAWWCGRRWLGLGGQARLSLTPLLCAGLTLLCWQTLPGAGQGARLAAALGLFAALAFTFDAAARRHLLRMAGALRRRERQPLERSLPEVTR